MDIEEILDVMGCKTRREILNLLREEPRFVSEISRELDIGQKAIIEHLRAMEELGILSSSFQKIERGRPRKYYDISQDIEIQIFISPESIKLNIIGEEFSELRNVEGRIRMGETEVANELRRLIKKYEVAKRHAEKLLAEVENPKKR
ncbi:MAG: ArsR family transcriptional regulator [Methanobacterium paludis]|uniref:Transcriptional regulator, ArsR family n=1 Tax=Methanobacterium paludis (strain DSM 25820 / JCM 18151 / SWAN1) TaxID=868131 RepID=F6D4L2_METPW|nr:ArsR family transcriptional regulator [Methanobacterium paludis]AEG19252.1 transcriptional regulator, ArsR family [Methanobacterium paludis]MCE7697475.1 ArsR family transcriptional regulator [Methanobacterium paludis]